MSTPFSAHHGASSSEYQQQFNDLSPQGFRMISLSVCGDPAAARYAAVWVKRRGPAWVAIHGVNATGYQDFFNSRTAQGFAPVLITAMGAVSSMVFAAVFEQEVNMPWFARHGLISGPDDNPSTFRLQCKWAQQNGFILRSAAIYGTSLDKCYAGVWVKNTTGVHWSCRTADPAGEYRKWFDAFTQLPYRPAYVTLSTNQLYLSVFRDDSVGTWVARHGLSSDEYQNEFNQRTAQGFYPICVQGGGVGSNTRYAVIFAKEDVPHARQWTVTGQAVPALTAFDEAVKEYMQSTPSGQAHSPSADEPLPAGELQQGVHLRRHQKALRCAYVPAGHRGLPAARDHLCSACVADAQPEHPPDHRAATGGPRRRVGPRGR